MKVLILLALIAVLALPLFSCATISTRETVESRPATAENESAPVRQRQEGDCTPGVDCLKGDDSTVPGIAPAIVDSDCNSPDCL